MIKNINNFNTIFNDITVNKARREKDFRVKFKTIDYFNSIVLEYHMIIDYINSHNNNNNNTFTDNTKVTDLLKAFYTEKSKIKFNNKENIFKINPIVYYKHFISNNNNQYQIR